MPSQMIGTEIYCRKIKFFINLKNPLSYIFMQLQRKIQKKISIISFIEFNSIKNT